MKTTPHLPVLWYSKGLKISKSHQHEALFLVTVLATNQWYGVHTSHEAMFYAHLPDHLDIPATGRTQCTTPNISKPPMSIYTRKGSHIVPKKRPQV